MITFFNKLANSWIAKVIFVALGISMMAIWGLGGFVNTDVQSQIAAKVGGEKIPVQKLLQDFSVARNNLAVQMGRPYVSPQEAVQQGLVMQVTNEAVQEALQQEVLDDLGLVATENQVGRYLEQNKAFQDANGRFDPALLQVYLNHMGLTQRQLLNKLQIQLAWKHLTDSVEDLVQGDEYTTALLYHYQLDPVEVHYVQLNPKDMKMASEPTDDVLKEYYEAYADELMVPEQRDLRVVVFEPKAFESLVQITDDEIESLYQEKKASYVVPEKRHVAQIKFETKEQADQARKTLTPKNFMTQARALHQADDITDFGVIARSDVLEEIAEAVFSAPVGTITPPVQTAAGWQVFWVKSMTPEQAPDKAKAVAEIKKELVANRVYDTTQSLSRQAEDLLGAGQDFTAVVAQLKLPVQNYHNVWPDGAQGNLPNDLKNAEILQTIFAQKQGESSPILEVGDKMYLVVVDNIVPLHKKDFALVKNDLAQKWRENQQKERLTAVADDVLKTIKEQHQFPTAYSPKVKKTTRQKMAQENSIVMNQLLNQETGWDAVAPIKLGDGVAFGVVLPAGRAKVDTASAEYESLNKQLSQSDTQNYLKAFMDAYAKEIGVKVNADVIEKAFAVYAGETEND